MTITFRPAKRENVGLWVNMIGGTGSGKTFSSFRMAAGIAGDKPFAVVDTENRRALHYADNFKFDHAELRAPFRPEAYADAIASADAAGYPVIVVDSASHEWAGEGGILDWQEDELDRIGGDDWKKRERVKMSAWIAPKRGHKAMVNKLLQLKAHLIMCFRAEPKVEMVKEDGKMVVRPKQSLTGLDGWLPVCEKNLPFEATCSFLLMADNPGIPHPIKLQEQHKTIFPLNQPINEDSGRRLAMWASGTKTVAPKVDGPELASGSSGSNPEHSDATAYITADEALTLEARCTDNQISVIKLKEAAQVDRISMIKPADLPRAHTWIDRVLESRREKASAGA